MGVGVGDCCCWFVKVEMGTREGSIFFRVFESWESLWWFSRGSKQVNSRGMWFVEGGLKWG